MPRSNPPASRPPPRPVVGLGNHHGLMDLGGGRGRCAELGLEFVPFGPELLGRTALKHSTLPPSPLPLSKASLPIFPATLSSLLPTPHAPSSFSPDPWFPPRLSSVGPPLSLLSLYHP